VAAHPAFRHPGCFFQLPVLRRLLASGFLYLCWLNHNTLSEEIRTDSYGPPGKQDGIAARGVPNALKAKVAKAEDDLRSRVGKSVKMGKKVVREHPVAAVGVALGATLAAGAIAGCANRAQDEAQGESSGKMKGAVAGHGQARY
jgi:hypothetical protein